MQTNWDGVSRYMALKFRYESNNLSWFNDRFFFHMPVDEVEVVISSAKGKGYLGTSPNGLVFYDGQVRGCVEIKCPYSARDKSVVDTCSMPQFYCNKDENYKITLKLRHNYYYQIQGQLAILNLEWCAFVVWTNVERVKRDPQFW